MWIDKRLPALRRHRGYALLVAGTLVSASIVIKLLLPDLPPFVSLFPAVLLSAFLGGTWVGTGALAICTVAAAYFLLQSTIGGDNASRIISITCFVLVGALIVFIVGLLDTSIQRLQRERRRLSVALQAAGASIWEIYPDGKVYWDENFYHLIGLDKQDVPPSANAFLNMVHPEDRQRLLVARELMNAGKEPARTDEYRLIRNDGSIIWLANHRTWIDAEKARYFIGFTQDISERKAAQQQVKALMAELAHRVKNQYAVILAMVRETNNQSRTKDDMEALVTARIQALSRSHDLLVHGNWEGADLRELLAAHMEAFGMTGRTNFHGPNLKVSPNAAQYIGLAIHELATNSVKHGAFSVGDGQVQISWGSVQSDMGDSVFRLEWRESGGGSLVTIPQTKGFGSKVLERITPAALGGKGHMTFDVSGIVWVLEVPAGGLRTEQLQKEY